MVASALPCARPRPTRRLRDRSPVQVRIKSPMPVSPMNVSVWPPRAVPRRVISARPRVISAARAFRPRPRPSATPVAIASTFLTAPPTSTPTRSSLAYTRMVPPCKAETTAPRKVALCEAMVSAHGRPRATSWANEGPDRAPPGILSPSTSSTIWCGSRPVPPSKPLQSHTRLPMALSFSCCSIGRRPATGQAAIRRPCSPLACATAASKSALMRSCGGKGKPGR